MARAVIDKLGEQPGEALTPERVEAIQTVPTGHRYATAYWELNRAQIERLLHWETGFLAQER